MVFNFKSDADHFYFGCPAFNLTIGASVKCCKSKHLVMAVIIRMAGLAQLYSDQNDDYEKARKHNTDIHRDVFHPRCCDKMLPGHHVKARQYAGC
jgi:hypothetical protein